MPKDKDTTSSIFISVGVGIASALALGVLVSKQRKGRTRRHVDDDLDFIPLTDQENQLASMGTAPLSTLTWFEGEHGTAAQILRDRVECILKINPWLGGRLRKRNGKVNVFIGGGASDADEIFTHCAAEDSRIYREMPIPDQAKIIQRECPELVLTMGGEFTQGFWKVSIVPSKTLPSEQFGLIVSMSHVIGDGHTFYCLHNMLLGDEPIRALKAHRIQSTTEQQEATMGKPEAGVLYSWGLIVTAVRGVFLSKVWSLIVGKSLRPTGRYFLVDAKKVEQLKQLELKTNGGAVPYVSTNDIISSWFMSQCDCSQGLMAVNFRNRLDGHTDSHAGNYENVVWYRSTTDAQSPSLIRRSVSDMKRAVTNNRPYSNYEMATATGLSLITNWSSFHGTDVNLPGCRQLIHTPIYDSEAVTPASMALGLIFRYTPQQLAVVVSGTPRRLAGLARAPFESLEPCI